MHLARPSSPVEVSYFVVPRLNMKSVALTETSQPLSNRSLFNLTRIQSPVRKPLFLSFIKILALIMTF